MLSIYEMFVNLLSHDTNAWQATGHNWVTGNKGELLKAKEDGDEVVRDALGNVVENAKKKAKLTSNEARKKKKGMYSTPQLGLLCKTIC